MSDHVARLRRLVGRELLLLPAAGAIIRDARGAILLQRRSEDGRWSLPGGAIDPGETPAAAVVREVREETGLEVQPVRIAGVFGGGDFRQVYPNGDTTEFTVIVFDCVVAGGTLGPGDHETAELRYFPVRERPTLTLPYPDALFEPADPAGPPVFNR